jgi:hypothetical protein
VRVSTLLVVLVLVGAPAAWLLLKQRDLDTVESRLAAVASEIAGRPVEVHCPSALEELVDISPNAGSVHFGADGQPGDSMKLNAETCSALSNVAHGVDARVSKALHVLAHESWHLAGIQDEAKADCYALQRVELAALRLGATTTRAQDLSRRANVDRQETAPADYRSYECRDNGALDLSPSPDWP